jgi:hypothetical protein
MLTGHSCQFGESMDSQKSFRGASAVAPCSGSAHQVNCILHTRPRHSCMERDALFFGLRIPPNTSFILNALPSRMQCSVQREFLATSSITAALIL